MHILNAINVNSLFLETKSLGQLGSLIFFLLKVCASVVCASLSVAWLAASLNFAWLVMLSGVMVLLS